MEKKPAESSENRDPVLFGEVIPEVIEHIPTWGEGEEEDIAERNLLLARAEDTGDIISKEIIKAAELRLQRVKKDKPDQNPRP